MNIKEAKEQIKNAMTAYFSKNEYGEFTIPIERQRPIILMGAPGIGKTAIMEQIASELGVGLVSYSMTHHTRQSALGLPFIKTCTFGGQEYSISEYTMSEIIASVYEMMEETGMDRGILFLDEINCVSETLAPSMLQFLQYKVFGRHRVPEGWIVVTAGNPPEYNNSVREFDIVTWDRMKRIDVDPDLLAWKEYAYKKGTHASITTYLDIKKDHFYKIETTVDGRVFVTARGWSDLSDMITLYEKNGLKVDLKLVEQYLQNPRIAKEFSIYYDLFNKYKSSYAVDEILAGTVSKAIKERAKKAGFDERLSLLGLMIDAAMAEVRDAFDSEQILRELMGVLKSKKSRLERSTGDALKVLGDEVEARRKEIATGKRSSSLSDDRKRALYGSIKALDELVAMVREANDDAPYQVMKTGFEKRTAELRTMTNQVKTRLGNIFAFCEEAFGEGQEMLILVTELTMGYYSAYFIGRYGCDEYFAHNKELLFYERQKDIISEIEKLGLD